MGRTKVIIFFLLSEIKDFLPLFNFFQKKVEEKNYALFPRRPMKSSKAK